MFSRTNSSRFSSRTRTQRLAPTRVAGRPAEVGGHRGSVRVDPWAGSPVHWDAGECRAFVALGYPTWDAYVDARFGDFRIVVPREHRQQAVAALAGVRMSVRAIASLLGVGVGTVHREMVSLSGVPDGTPDGEEQSLTLGTDGKLYPRRRSAAASTCVTCGDRHPVGTRDCPWDLFAQGHGSRPESRSGREGEAPDPAVGPPVNPTTGKRRPKPPMQQQETVEHGEPNLDNLPVIRDLTEAVDRAEGLRAQIAVLVQLVNNIHTAVTARPSPSPSEPSAARVRELACCPRSDLTGMQGLVDLLESVADDLHPR